MLYCDLSVLTHHLHTGPRGSEHQLFREIGFQTSDDDCESVRGDLPALELHENRFARAVFHVRAVSVCRGADERGKIRDRKRILARLLHFQFLHRPVYVEFNYI